MASFYLPIVIELNSVPTIVYPCLGLETVFDRKKQNCLDRYLKSLYQAAKLTVGQYHIIIMWADNEDTMCDIWIFDKIESWGSGPLVDVKIFRNLKQDINTGVSAGDGLIMLGRETELEEKLRKNGKNLNDYINSERAQLPEEIKPIEEFYIN